MIFKLGVMDLCLLVVPVAMGIHSFMNRNWAGVVVNIFVYAFLLWRGLVLINSSDDI